MPVAPSEETVKEILADLTATAVAEVEARSKGWPKEMADIGTKVLGIVTEQVNSFLSGDTAALRDALVKDIVKLAATGKSATSKSFSDIA